MKQIQQAQLAIVIVMCVIFPEAGESSDPTAGMGPGAPAARAAPLNFKTRLCDNFEKAMSIHLILYAAALAQDSVIFDR